MTSIHKKRDQLELLWSYTAQVDAWVIEHIRYVKNEWKQIIQIISNVISIHEKDEEPDIISYADPETRKNLFGIGYHNNHCNIGRVDNYKLKTNFKLMYESPEFFKDLERLIFHYVTIAQLIKECDIFEKKLQSISDWMCTSDSSVIYGSKSMMEAIALQFDAIDMAITRLKNMETHKMEPKDINQYHCGTD